MPSRAVFLHVFGSWRDVPETAMRKRQPRSRELWTRNAPGP